MLMNTTLLHPGPPHVSEGVASVVMVTVVDGLVLSVVRGSVGAVVTSWVSADVVQTR